MLQRLFWLAIFAGLGWWVYDSGLWYGLTHDLRPEPGRAVTLVGTYGDGVYVASSKENTRWFIDAHLGTEGQRIASRLELAAAVNRGLVSQLDDGAKATAGETEKVLVHGVKFSVVKINLDGGAGWVMREDVVDTPLQEVYKSMAKTKKKSQASTE